MAAGDRDGGGDRDDGGGGGCGNRDGVGGGTSVDAPETDGDTAGSGDISAAAPTLRGKSIV